MGAMERIRKITDKLPVIGLDSRNRRDTPQEPGKSRLAIIRRAQRLWLKPLEASPKIDLPPGASDAQPLLDSGRIKPWKKLEQDARTLTNEIDQKLGYVLPHLSFRKGYDLTSRFYKLQTMIGEQNIPSPATIVIRENSSSEKARRQFQGNINSLQGILDELNSRLPGAPRLNIIMMVPSVEEMEKRFSKVSQDLNNFFNTASGNGRAPIDKKTRDEIVTHARGCLRVEPSAPYPEGKKLREAFRYLRLLQKARDEYASQLGIQRVETPLEDSDQNKPQQLKRGIKRLDTSITHEWSRVWGSASPEQLPEIAGLVRDYEPIIQEQIKAYNRVSGYSLKKMIRGIQGLNSTEGAQKLQKKVQPALDHSQEFLGRLQDFNELISASKSVEPLEVSVYSIFKEALNRIDNSRKELKREKVIDSKRNSEIQMAQKTAQKYEWRSADVGFNRAWVLGSRDYQGSLLQKYSDFNLYLAEAYLNAARSTNNPNPMNTDTGAERIRRTEIIDEDEITEV